MAVTTIVLCMVVLAVCGLAQGTVPQTKRVPDMGLAACRDELPFCVTALSAGTDCEVLPVPDVAKYEPVTSPKGFEVTEVRPGVFIIVADEGTFLIALSSAKAIIVAPPETPVFPPLVNQPKTVLIDAVREVIGDRPELRRIVIFDPRSPHRLADPTNAFMAFLRDFYNVRVSIYVSRRTRHAMGAEGLDVSSFRGVSQPQEYVFPDVGTFTLEAANDDSSTLAVSLARNGSSQGVYLHRDIVKPYWSPSYSKKFVSSVDRFVGEAVIVEKYAKSCDIFISGSGRPSPCESVLVSTDFIQDLWLAAGDAIFRVDAYSSVRRSAVFDKFNKAYQNQAYAESFYGKDLVNDCATVLMAKWGCELAGMELNVRKFCESAVQLRLEQ